MLQRLRSLFYVGAILFLLFLAACDFITVGEQNGLLTPTPVSSQTEITPEANMTDGVAVITGTEELPQELVSPLKIWVPTDTSGLADSDTEGFVPKLVAFADSPSEIDTIVQEKALLGTGGILSYLRAGRGVADAALPDLVILPTSQLKTAVSEGLITSLEEFVDRDTVMQQLYPAAAQMAQIDGELVGYPFALTNLTHLAFDPALITETVPVQWTTFISSTQRSLVLPAAGTEVGLLTYQLYQDFGGELVSEAGQATLQVEPLTNALTLLQTARTDHNFITVDSLNINTFAEAWESYRNGSAKMVLTTVSDYWPHQFVEPVPFYGPIPGVETTLTPLVDGWVVVMTATEARRPLAADFLRNLVSAPNVAEWSAEHKVLPASQAAFELWNQQGDPYLTFLHSQLVIARANPILLESSLMETLKNAAFDVLSLSELPPAAAQKAVEATKN